MLFHLLWQGVPKHAVQHLAGLQPEKPHMHQRAGGLKGITKRTLRALEQIAMAADYSLELRGDIEERNNDSEDFPEVSINAIQAMLEKAYLLGKADGMKKAQ